MLCHRCCMQNLQNSISEASLLFESESYRKAGCKWINGPANKPEGNILESCKKHEFGNKKSPSKNPVQFVCEKIHKSYRSPKIPTILIQMFILRLMKIQPHWKKEILRCFKFMATVVIFIKWNVARIYTWRRK